MVRDGGTESMCLICVDPERRTTGRSIERGAVITGVQAKVPEVVLYLQSGYGEA
jgi:hypothetical protein